jgi:hypothetical protein
MSLEEHTLPTSMPTSCEHTLPASMPSYSLPTIRSPAEKLQPDREDIVERVAVMMAKSREAKSLLLPAYRQNPLACGGVPLEVRSRLAGAFAQYMPPKCATVSLSIFDRFISLKSAEPQVEHDERRLFVLGSAAMLLGSKLHGSAPLLTNLNLVREQCTLPTPFPLLILCSQGDIVSLGAGKAGEIKLAEREIVDALKYRLHLVDAVDFIEHIVSFAGLKVQSLNLSTHTTHPSMCTL